MGEGQLVALVVQGGFGALVALFVWKSFERENRMAGRMDSIEDRSLTAIENNTRAVTELTETLRHRPCLRERGGEKRSDDGGRREGN